MALLGFQLTDQSSEQYTHTYTNIEYEAMGSHEELER